MRSTVAQPRIASAAAVSSGIPAMVITNASAVVAAVNATENSTQPVTNT